MSIYNEPTIYKNSGSNKEELKTLEISDFSSVSSVINSNNNNTVGFAYRNGIVYINYWLDIKSLPVYSNVKIIDGENIPFKFPISGKFMLGDVATCDNNGVIPVRLDYDEYGNIYLFTRELAISNKVITGVLIGIYDLK